jgi:acyl-CoA synthetase (AMP-forming)/AMP-acid ligase II
MAGDGFGERVAFGSRQHGLTYSALLDRARRTAAWAAGRGVERVGLVEVNSDAVPTLLYGAGFAGMPFVPVNYRLADEQVRDILRRTAPSVVVVEDTVSTRVGPIEGVELVTRAAFAEEIDGLSPDDAPSADELSDEDIALLLFTSGTTGDPKAAVLRHRHLTSYVISTVEFMGADEHDAALVSVPPYHVAGTTAVITGVFAGRRVFYLAIGSDDTAVRRRLGSVGRPLPTLEVEIRDPDGSPVGAGETGQIWVRGEQVAGEYLGRADTKEDGWFPTNDSGSLDADGFLYLEGRLDDVTVRGGENLSPGEIEDVLLGHPAVADAGVVGVPDTEWGEAVVAAVVLADGSAATEPELQAWVQRNLRSSKTPSYIQLRDELPYTDTGKLLRRVLKAELTEAFGSLP